MSGSNIATIVDYTAAVAAGIAGVKAVAAAGLGEVDDPLRPGQKIASSGSNPTGPYTHWSEVPGAPPVEWVTQSGTVQLLWTIPMRLWLPGSDEEARRTALPFYDGYLRAFVMDRLLGGLALRTEVARFAIGGDASWSWLDVGIRVWEQVNYGQ